MTGNNLLNSYGLAVDQNDYAWIPSEQSLGINGGLGTPWFSQWRRPAGFRGNGISQGGLNFPVSIAIDTSGSNT